jgi:cytochrome c oxidase subunit 2
MPHFRAQMNCVPGMVTQFAFTPSMTTTEMRETKEMTEKVANINKIRETKSKQLVAEGKTALDPYQFDFLLLCNKICGSSHYNMQMKVVVESEADYKKWLNEKTKLVQSVKTAVAEEAAAKLAESNPAKIDSASVKKDTTIVAEAPTK